MNGDNGQHRVPAELLDARSILTVVPVPGELARRRTRRSALVASALFVLTLLSTLAVGTQFALTYAAGQPPFGAEFSPWAIYTHIFNQPRLLLLGLPFSFTLMAILLAHELGHFFACQYYGISASYPYFIPAPTIIGTMGAFIRIRSPIINRKALFDVGLAGPVVGFLFALPALAIAIAYSKVVPGAQAAAAIQFGNPPLVRLLVALLRPHVRPADLLLDPVGRAAWVGLFATALNLLPAGQLDGGHIVYALASEKHRQLSIAVALALVPLAYFWFGWLVWAVLLVLIGFRHPPLLNRWEPLDRRRLIWAAIGLAIFVLCFVPRPFVLHMP
jgi:membrane-associated protease RseP (regulator of RpoE activity)